MSAPFPTLKQIQKARDLISPMINKTPLYVSKQLNEVMLSSVFLKCENLNVGSSFKIRGAFHAVMSTPKEVIGNGVATHSSGNHGQAIAIAARMNKLKAVIVMPENSAQVKLDAVKRQQAEIVMSQNTEKARMEMLQAVVNSRGFHYIPCADDDRIITGAATAAFEIYEELNSLGETPLDFLLAPVGAGGLLSGTSLSSKYLSPKTKVIGIEPELAKDAYLSFKTGVLHDQFPPVTIADGLRIGLGKRTFEIISNLVDDIITVEEDEIIEALKLYWQTTRMMLEPSSATVFAAILKDHRFRNKRIGAILSGGNLDIKKISF